MTQDNYFIIMAVSVTCMLLTGLIFFTINIPQSNWSVKLRSAKRALAIACLVMAAGNGVQLFLDPQGGSDELTGLLTLLIGYAQAMLFTMTAMVLISPGEVTSRRVWGQSVAIACADVVLLLAFFLLPHGVFLVFYILGIAGYVAQLVLYTRWYLRNYRKFKLQIADYYEEEQINRRLRWIQSVFWTELTIGVAVMVLFFGTSSIDMWLTPVMAAVYACYAVWFVNYMIETPLILPAIYNSEPATPLRPTPEEDKRQRLEQWVQAKRYLNTETSTKDIAHELGMNVDQMHQYFREVVGEEFRTWRIRRRVEEARQLMADHPDYSATQIGRLAGFNDRSYFYQQFARFTGTTLQAYRKQIGSCSVPITE